MFDTTKKTIVIAAGEIDIIYIGEIFYLAAEPYEKIMFLQVAFSSTIKYYDFFHDTVRTRDDSIEIKNPDYKEPEPEIDLDELHKKLMNSKLWCNKSSSGGWFKCEAYDILDPKYLFRGNWRPIEYFKDAEFKRFPKR